MARIDDISYAPAGNSHEIHFAHLLSDFANELDRMLHGFGAVPDDAESTRAILMRLRKPLAETFKEYFDYWPSGYEPEPTPEPEPAVEPNRRNASASRFALRARADAYHRQTPGAEVR